MNVRSRGMKLTSEFATSSYSKIYMYIDTNRIIINLNINNVVEINFCSIIILIMCIGGFIYECVCVCGLFRIFGDV